MTLAQSKTKRNEEISWILVRFPKHARGENEGEKTGITRSRKRKKKWSVIAEVV